MNTNEIDTETQKRFSRNLNTELYSELSNLLKSNYRNNFSSFTADAIRLFNLGLDALTELPEFSNAVEVSGLTESDFIQKAVQEKIAKTIREEKLKQDKLSKLECEDNRLGALENLKGKFSAFLRIKACLNEIEQYNWQINPEQRIYITKTLLAEVTNANSRSLKQFMASEKGEIDRINEKFELTNPNSNRNNIKAFKAYLDTRNLEAS